MSEKYEIKPIAYIYNDFTSKFAVPRQSGICKNLISEIVFEKEYRRDEALRGIEEFSNLWLIWQFSDSLSDTFHPTVRPPRLGGNRRMGVFATRSPFRPNSLGLSCVKLEGIKKDEKKGSILLVSGADLKNGTPIFDIKPYLAFSDAYPDAVGGFSDAVKDYELEVEFDEKLLNVIPKGKRQDVITILKNDPRPSYHSFEDREYGFSFGDFEIKFKVGDRVLEVTDVICRAGKKIPERKRQRK